MVLGDTSLVPWDEGTAGSRSTPDMVPQIRKVAAAAREALIDLAARKWGVERTTLTATEGQIVHSNSGRSLGYGEPTQGEKLALDVFDAVALIETTRWRVMGTAVSKVDGPGHVTGQHSHPSEANRPGMRHARVLRARAYGATLVSLEARAAEAMPGVKVVRDGDFVGVTTSTGQAAAQASDALRAEWKTSPQVSEHDLWAHLRRTARNVPRTPPTPSAGELRGTYTVA